MRRILAPGVPSVAVYPGYGINGIRVAGLGDGPLQEFLPRAETGESGLQFGFPALPLLGGLVGAFAGGSIFKKPMIGAIAGGVIGYVIVAGARALKSQGV